MNGASRRRSQRKKRAVMKRDLVEEGGTCGWGIGEGWLVDGEGWLVAKDSRREAISSSRSRRSAGPGVSESSRGEVGLEGAVLVVKSRSVESLERSGPDDIRENRPNDQLFYESRLRFGLWFAGQGFRTSKRLRTCLRLF
jgi:hypothetical protein